VTTDLLMFDAIGDPGLPGLTSRQDRHNRHADGKQLLCRACANPITTPTAAIDMAGAHQHRFSNPTGQAFTIGCFRSAPGCRVEGEAWRQYSWFPGYTWQIALCGRCACHLGWRFQADTRFYGLISKKLRSVG